MKNEIVLIFNPLKNIVKRGISIYSMELELLLKERNVDVVSLEMPNWFVGKSKLILFFGFLLWQQVILPIQMLKYRPSVVIDAYNTYSILGAFLSKYIYIIHDFIPFERERWWLRPNSVYQRALHFLAPLFPRLYVYCIAPDIQEEAKIFIKVKTGILPNLVKKMMQNEVTVDVDLQRFCDVARANGEIFITTISGSSSNKDFDGLLERLDVLRKNIALLSFGFPDCFEKKSKNGYVKVFSPGRRDAEQIGNMIARSDIFVFHSISEGFGRPIVEALMENKIVLASDVSPSLSFLSDKAKNNLIVYSLDEDFSEAFYDALNKKPIAMEWREVLIYNEDFIFNEIKRVMTI